MKNIEYLKQIELLAKNIVSAAIDESSFEVFRDIGEKTPLQQAITKLAQQVHYKHEANDGCLGCENK